MSSQSLPSLPQQSPHRPQDPPRHRDGHPAQSPRCVIIKQLQRVVIVRREKPRRGQSCAFPFELTEDEQDGVFSRSESIVGAEFKANTRQHHTTEEELGMPWMVALVGVPLMALKI